MKEASVGVVVQQGKDIYGRESKLVLQQTVQVQVQVKVGLATLSRLWLLQLAVSTALLSYKSYQTRP